MLARRTLRFKLTLWYCGALALVMLLFGALLYGLVRHRLLGHHDRMLREKVAEIQAILGEQEDCHILTRAQTEALDHLGQIVLLHDLGGTQATYYQSPEMKANSLAPTVQALGWIEAPGAWFSTISYKGAQWRVLAQPYRARSGRQGVIRVMENLGEVEETLEHFRFAIFFLIPAGTLCCAVGGYWLAGRALAPVAALADQVRQIEASKLDRRLPHPGVEDEIGSLVDTLNHMIERLENSFDAMKRFTADASHELRNPLATMRNTLDVMLKRPRTVEEQRAAMVDLGEDVDRLRRIVDDLLLLARADNGRVALAREPVLLDQMVQALVELQQPEAEERGVTLAAACPAPAAVFGDERWLYQLLGILLDNALKFTPPGGAITVEVNPREEHVDMRVLDTGPGIPAADLERIFKRFYQADPSRSRDQKPGSGLGLAIAEWIVKSHGGSISAANRDTGGAVLSVRLPLSPPG